MILLVIAFIVTIGILFVVGPPEGDRVVIIKKSDRTYRVHREGWTFINPFTEHRFSFYYYEGPRSEPQKSVPLNLQQIREHQTFTFSDNIKFRITQLMVYRITDFDKFIGIRQGICDYIISSFNVARTHKLLNVPSTEFRQNVKVVLDCIRAEAAEALKDTGVEITGYSMENLIVE